MPSFRPIDPRIARALSPRQWAPAAAALGIYAVLYLSIHRVAGPGAAVIAGAPALLAGATRGIALGVIVALASAGETSLLWYLTGVEPGEAVLRAGSGYGAVLIVSIGAITGYLHDARETLRHEHRRYAEAVAEREADVRDAFRELTTPLVAIGAASRALASDSADAVDRSARLREIADEADGAVRTLRQLLDVATIQARHAHLALAPLDLVGLVQRVLRSFDAGTRPVVVNALATPTLVRGDEEALAKVLRYLLSNAVSYSTGGPIEVTVLLVGAGTVEVSVRDHGPGIPAAERASLFRKFARLSTAGGTRGAGLSLYVSQAILDEHGTRLRFDAPRGGGARFSFTLPVEPSGPVPSVA